MTTATNGTVSVEQPIEQTVQPVEQATVLSVPKIEIQHMYIRLIGDSELICHRWSEKAKKEMLDKQMKKATKGKAAKSPEDDYLSSMYILSGDPQITPDGIQGIEECTFGFPAVAFKAAAVSACRDTDMKMTEARGRFHINGELVAINGLPHPREDMVRIGMGTADIRYRGGFTEWSVDLDVVYNSRAISPEQIINLFNIAGFGVGIGEWRPEKNGPYGRFHVATESDYK